MDIFSIVPIDVFMDERLSKTHLRVLGAILSFRNKDTNLCWPKREQIAERCGLPLCKISTATTHLVDLGWLEKSGDGGRSRSTQYKFLIPTLAAKTLTDLVTVTDPVTLTDSVTKTLTESVRGIKQTNEQTNEQTNKELVVHEKNSTDFFDIFYEAYPRKENRASAEKSWKKIDSGLYEMIITDVINRSLNHDGWKDRTFIPHPSTYLNQKRWNDEITARNPSSGAIHQSKAESRFQGNVGALTQLQDLPVTGIAHEQQ